MLEWYNHLRFQSSFFILDLLDIHQIADFMAMSMLNSFKTLPEPQTQVIDYFFCRFKPEKNHDMSSMKS